MVLAQMVNHKDNIKSIKLVSTQWTSHSYQVSEVPLLFLTLDGFYLFYTSTG